jgi:hypothetical protein
MPSENEKPMWEKFVDLYNSNFDKLGDLDGRPEWAEFIGKLKAENFVTLRKILESLSEENAKTGRTRGPKLGTVRYLFFKELKERRFDNPFNGNLECARCMKTGWLKGIYSYVKRRLIDPAEYTGGDFVEILIPCSCEHGAVHAPGVHWRTRQQNAEKGFSWSFTRWDIENKLSGYARANAEKKRSNAA